MASLKNVKVKRLLRRHKRSKPATIMLTSLIDIFTVLVFFLIVNSENQVNLPSNDSLTLPKSVSDQLPQKKLSVLITPTDIFVEEQKVAAIKDIIGSDADVIPTLADELKYRAKKIPPTVNAEGVPEREIYIMGDKDIPYSLLRKVMVTCSLNDFSKISFAVERSGRTGGGA